jgi:hypothetical protein
LQKFAKMLAEVLANKFAKYLNSDNNLFPYKSPKLAEVSELAIGRLAKLKS